MSVRMITVSAPDQTIPPIKRKAEELGATGIRTYAETQRDGRTTLQMLVGSAARQDVVDAVQAALSALRAAAASRTLHPAAGSAPRDPLRPLDRSALPSVPCRS